MTWRAGMGGDGGRLKREDINMLVFCVLSTVSSQFLDLCWFWDVVAVV